MSINDRVAGGARRNARCWAARRYEQKIFSTRVSFFRKKDYGIPEKNHLAQLFP
jgi:hypothetical protein